MIRLLLVFFVCSILSSCIETAAVASYFVYFNKKTARNSDSLIKDSKIAHKLRSQRARKRYDGRLVDMGFAVYEGRVLLTGTYQKKSDIKSFIKQAWSVAGVVELINETKLYNPRSKKRDSLISDSLISDSLISSAVKARLIKEDEISALNINVEVRDGKVYLLGALGSNSEIRRAAKVSSRVKGVKKVISHLRVDI
jgi:osmotically-inducible protein OsmY